MWKAKGTWFLKVDFEYILFYIFCDRFSRPSLRNISRSKLCLNQTYFFSYQSLKGTLLSLRQVYSFYFVILVAKYLLKPSNIFLTLLLYILLTILRSIVWKSLFFSQVAFYILKLMSVVLFLRVINKNFKNCSNNVIVTSASW